MSSDPTPPSPSAPPTPGSGLVDFVIAQRATVGWVLVVIGLAWYVNGFGNLPALLSLVPTLLLLFLLGWALALIAGFCNVYFQDTQHLCDVVFQIAFYCTPIIYAPENLRPGRFQWLVTHCNPMVPILSLIRDPILHGRVPPLENYGTALVATLALACVAALVQQPVNVPPPWPVQRQTH